MPQLLWAATSDGRVQYYNPHLNLYATNPQQEDGSFGWAPLVHPDDVGPTTEAWNTATRAGTAYEFQHRMKMADGTYRWHISRALPVQDADGETKWFGSATDIDALRNAQARLNRLSELIDLAHEPIFTWRYDGGIVDWNAGAAALYGYAREEAVGQRSHTLLKTKHSVPIEEFWRELGETGQWFGELNHTAKDGRIIVVEARHQLVTTSDGAILVLETCRDITQRKLHEQQLEVALRNKDEFLGLVSHELRTPITTILGNASVLSRTYETLTTETIKESMRDIVGEARRLERTVDDLLALARVEQGATEMEPVLLAHIVDAVCEDLSRERGRTCRVSQPPGLIVVGERGLIGHVLRNFLSNAAKYSPIDEPIDILVEENGDRVRISVLDRGIGVAAEDQEQIFEPFFRSQRTSHVSGIGIGLSVCSRLAEAMHGSISTEPREGGGSVFTLELPAYSGAD